MLALDSDFCIEVIRRRTAAVRWFEQQSHAELSVPAIVAAELCYGGHRRANPALEITLGFLRPFPILPFDSRAAEHYGFLRNALERSGTVIGPHDMLIAATVLAHNAILITRNTREFIRIPGLRLKTWPN